LNVATANQAPSLKVVPTNLEIDARLEGGSFEPGLTLESRLAELGVPSERRSVEQGVLLEGCSPKPGVLLEGCLAEACPPLEGRVGELGFCVERSAFKISLLESRVPIRSLTSSSKDALQ
jgi:hypothetical protein